MTQIGHAEIMAALRGRHRDSRAWAYFEELRVGTGYRDGAEQRLDAWAMSLWPSKGLVRITYEVKVSRADFRRELKAPLKRRIGLLYSNLFYFVTPVGLLKPEEIPPECGLIEVGSATRMAGLPDVFVLSLDDDRPHASVTVPAPFRDTPPPGWRFLAAIARRAMAA